MERPPYYNTRTYFVTNVIPAFEEFALGLGNGVVTMGGDLRRLGYAAQACLHLADYAFDELWQKLGYPSKGTNQKRKFMDARKAESYYFHAVHDIANSIKHKNLSRDDIVVDGIGSIGELVSIKRFQDSKGYFYVAGKIVLVNVKDKPTWLADDMVFNAITQWRSWLIAQSVLPRSRMQLFESPRVFQRAEVPAGPRITIAPMKGEYFETRVESMIYDPEADSFREVEDDDEFDTVLTLDVSQQKSRFEAVPPDAPSQQYLLIRGRNVTIVPPRNQRSYFVLPDE